MKEYKPFIWLGFMALAYIFRDVLGIVVAIFGYGLLALVALALLLVIIALVADALDKIRMIKFKKIYEGQYFLWYSSNKRLKGYIETDLKPLLDMDYEVIFMKRTVPQTRLKKDHYLFLFYKTESVKLPRLICIRNGEPVTVSFYNELYRLKTGVISKEVFKTEVMNKLNALRVNNE